MEDVFKTLAEPTQETLFKDKGSKFFGYAFPVTSLEEVKIRLEEVKKKHPAARHHCYTWQLGVDKIRFRANDDGEPSNTAGMPMYGQIKSFDVTNVLVVSVRYFGGVKLGVGGLINAYRTSAQITLEEARIVEKTVNLTFEITFGYDLLNKVMRLIKEKSLYIISQKMELDCQIIISVRKKNAEEVKQLFDSVYKVDIKQLNL